MLRAAVALAAILFTTPSMASEFPNDVINPIDQENLGFLKFIGAPDPDPLRPQIARTKLPYNAQLGQPVRVMARKHRLTITSGALASTLSEVEVVARKTTDLQLSALRVEWGTALKVDVGPKLSPQFTGGTLQIEGRVFDNGGDWSRITGGADSRYAALFPDTIKVKYSAPILGSHQFTVPAGQVHTEVLSPPEKRAAINIKAPAKVFKNSVNEYCKMNLAVVQRQWRSGGWGHLAFHFPAYIYNHEHAGREGLLSVYFQEPEKDQLIHYLPSTDGTTPLYYELVVNNTWMPLNVQPGQTLNVQLKRLDVNSVKVTREDGSTYMAPGRFKVWRQGPGGPGDWQYLQVPEFSSCSREESMGQFPETFPTETGLTVLPGVYRIIVYYQTEEGPKNSEHMIDLR